MLSIGELEDAEADVDGKEEDALQTRHPAAEERRKRQKRHNEKHDGDVNGQRRRHRTDIFFQRNFKRADGRGRSADENDVEEIGTDDVAEREGAVSFDERCNGGDEFGQ